MSMRNICGSLVVLAALFIASDRASGMGEILGQSKEQLKLQYDVSVDDNGIGGVSVDISLADDGRLKPIDSVALYIPKEQKNADGSISYDLVVEMNLRPTKEGKRTARFQIRKEWAGRAEIWLNTFNFDGKPLVMTHYHYVIPVAPFLKTAAAATTQKDK